MPNYTEFLNLEKPLQSEQYNVDVFNSNCDKIDNFAKSQIVPIATTETAGIVKPDGTTITVQEDGTISSVVGDDFAGKDINNLTSLGNARLQYAPFAINSGVVENGENNTLKFPEGQGSYIVEVTGTLPDFGTWNANRTVTHTFDEVKTLKSFTASYRVNPNSGTYASISAVATLANDTTVTLASYGLDGRVDIWYRDIVYTFPTPTEVKSLTFRGAFSSRMEGTVQITNASYVELVQYSSADTIICNPCTITTCDGRTKIFDTATSIDISNQADGSYSIFKDYETGSLSLVDELVIGKTNTVPWTQPVLSTNGTIGGDSFAVEASSEYSSSTPAWKAFDNDNSTRWSSSYTSSNVYIDFYNPQALNVTNLSFKNISSGGGYTYVPTAGYVQISNDGANWTTIKNFINSTTGDAQTWNIDLSDNTNFAKYYRVYGTTMSQSYGWCITELKITANLKLYNYLDASTIPANLKVNDEINNDLVYIGDCTIASGLVTALTNREFNDSGYLVQKSAMSVPDFMNRIDVGTTLNSTVTYTAPCKGYISVNLWSYSTSCSLKINNVLLYQTQGSGTNYTPAVTTFVPVQKNDYIEAYSGYPNTSGTDQKVYFYPMRGE